MTAPVSDSFTQPQETTHFRARHTNPTSVSAMLRLFSYVRPHSKHALLTALFGSMGFMLSFVYPWIIGGVIDLISSDERNLDDRTAQLTWLTQLSIATAVLHAVVVYGRGHFNVQLGDGVARDIRRDLFDHLQRLGSAYYTRQRTGGIIARVIQDVHESMAIIYGGIIVAVLDAAQLLIAAALLLKIHWQLAVPCILIFPVYGFVFARLNPRVRITSDKLAEHFAQLTSNLHERVAGQSIIKTYTAESREAARFRQDLTRHHELVVAQSRQGHLVVSYGEVLVHLGTTIIIGYGGWLGLRGELTPGMLTRFLGYAVVLYGPVRRLAELNMTYQSSLAAMRRVFRMLEVVPAITEPHLAHTLPITRGEVCFDDVWFRFGTSELEHEHEHNAGSNTYGSRREWILKGVSFRAAPGERVAVVGASGAGKTTLVSLIPRLHDVTAGRVTIDGVDMRQFSVTTLRSAIALVQQESFLFSGTISENIAYGRPQATEQEVLAAARAANVDEFVSRLPEGYDTLLGERGVNLSGGQRQRLSIARALLKEPRILVLDEATSALDAESESSVQEALERLMQGRTCFIVAHRLSTIRTADRIIVLERGCIAESDTHDELMQSRGSYYRLVQKQSETTNQRFRASA